ncbi:MAG: choice-of-anchor B family protein [bacterium]|nr:choice-of-anchor B family protein [bacterium]
MSYPHATSSVRRALVLIGATALLATSLAGAALGHPDHDDRARRKGVPVPETQAEIQLAAVAALERLEHQRSLEAIGYTACRAGLAAGYPCDGVDLVSFVPLSTLGGGEGNDLWGWTDPDTGRDFAIMGRTTGITFVDITNPLEPEVVGTLPSHSVSSLWRDLKVYDSYAYIVSEAGGSGLQVFDLRQLAPEKNRPHVFEETAWLGAFSTTHNLMINEDTGFAYAAGTNNCAGGLHMVNLANPVAPVSAGCFSADGYTHDVQCVVYSGPDTDHQGSEICFASNEDTLTIVDVSNKADPQQLSRTGYVGSGYAHQGWLTDDQVYFVADDELDELSGAGNTRTFVWDVSDLDRPSVDFTHSGATPAIDHNQYIHNGRSYQANYKAGLRILSVDRLHLGVMKEVAYFDTHPESNSASFDGAWSIYPFYNSNIVAISTIDRGLFVVGYEGEAGSVHVGDLDSASRAKGTEKWKAVGKVEVHDSSGDPVEGATVTVRWSSGNVKSCVTGPLGRCKTKIVRYNRKAKVAFRVLDIESGGASYASWLNEDPDGDSDGFRKTVKRPTL